ncbi:putative peroxisomal carrier protein [Erysiphe necator]|uniref:Putative peroxisomal carrier protein n=1 Tax=Uncinula necator TaxID=52586 RepID=A0A0B1NY96_UNCNE|nr:putative peroxisomal carrier protein [Erysiphe necator]
MINHSKQASIPPWVLAVSGATGAVIANTIVYPLDIVKTRLQVQVKQKPSGTCHNDNQIYYKSTWDAILKIIDRNGVCGLYAGINGALIGVASTNFAYFYFYSIVRTFYMSSRKYSSPPGTITELTMGAVAGAAAQLLTIPVSVITTRQQTQAEGQDKGIVDTAKEIIESDDGWTGLWRGLKASLVLTINPAITYGAYQRLRQLIFPRKINLRPREAFLLGAVSKSLATIATQPLIVAKVGLQSKSLCQRSKPFKSFVEVLHFIIENEGPTGLFKGIGPQVLKGLIVQGLLMMTKERVELLFILLFRYIKLLRSSKVKHISTTIVSTHLKS